MFHVTILMDTKSVSSKVADAELHFTDQAGPLAGLKLIGFQVWERKSTGTVSNMPIAHRFNVTFPARQYSINGERRSFALLRPATGNATTELVRDAILTAYELMLSTQV